MGQLEDMQAFVRVVEAGGIGPAAEQMGVAKSAVSRRLSELEKRLGITLINRTTRTSKITDAGQTYYTRSLQLINEVTELNSITADPDCSLHGTLRLSAPLSFGLLLYTYLTNTNEITLIVLIIAFSYLFKVSDVVEYFLIATKAYKYVFIVKITTLSSALVFQYYGVLNNYSVYFFASILILEGIVQSLMYGVILYVLKDLNFRNGQWGAWRRRIVRINDGDWKICIICSINSDSISPVLKYATST